VRSERLELIPATLDLCRAERSGREEMARILDAQIPESWPPPVFEPDDLERLRQQLEANPETGDWTLHYLVECESPGRRALVGVAGYVGPPTAERGVEIGYAVAEEHQRRGYATEAVLALVTRAFEDQRVDVVAATTYSTLVPSIGVLTKAGFTHVDSDPGTGLLRFERRRDVRVPGPASTGTHP
jgi:RimJ/RimL family protein N-acetyltransferase